MPHRFGNLVNPVKGTGAALKLDVLPHKPDTRDIRIVAGAFPIPEYRLDGSGLFRQDRGMY
jgi:hypothetical protein